MERYTEATLLSKRTFYIQGPLPPLKPASKPAQPDILTVGDRISVYWTGDKEYYHGTVHESTSEDGELLHQIAYDDGTTVYHNLRKERWNRLGNYGMLLAEASPQEVVANIHAKFAARAEHLTLSRRLAKHNMIAAMYTLAKASELEDDLTAMIE